jgi:hypothetical protein
MRVLVSLPVHEAPGVVQHQLENLEHFLENPTVVLHVSADFDIEPNSLATSKRVLVNPERFRTGWGTGICAGVHLSNLKHALKTVEFDYAVLASSNELYVRHGLESYLAGFEAGVSSGEFSSWFWRSACLRDRPLRNLLRQHRIAKPSNGQVEGLFLRRDILEQVLATLEPVDQSTPWKDSRFSDSQVALQKMSEDHLSDSLPQRIRRWLQRRTLPMMRLPLGLHHLIELSLARLALYPREEVYFSTAIEMCALSRIGRSVTYMNWRRNLELNEAEVEAISSGNLHRLPEGGSHSPEDHLFSVKRVPREVNAPLRQFIDELSAVSR